MKEFLKSPKKTAILGLIGSIIILGTNLINIILNNAIDFTNITQHIFKVGMVLYFLIIVMRLYSNLGNVKIANVILLVTLILQVFFSRHIFYARDIITIIVYLIMILYFIRILFNKNTLVNNIVFLIAIVIFSITNVIRYNSILLKIMGLAYFLIIPYFYGYLELLKEGKKNG